MFGMNVYFTVCFKLNEKKILPFNIMTVTKLAPNQPANPKLMREFQELLWRYPSY